MPWRVLPTETEIVAIHAALLPTSPEGDVLYFGDWAGVTDRTERNSGPTLCRLYHMASQTVEGFATADAPSTNAFCSGHAFMARGTLLVAGGTVRRPPAEEVGETEDAVETDAAELAEEGMEPPSNVHEEMHHWDGERACWVYLPFQKRWARVRDLNFQPASTTQGGGRWYPMLVALSDGEVFAAGGHPSWTDAYISPLGGPGQRHNNNTPERYSSETDSWTLITSAVTAPNALETDEFPRFRLLPNRMLFTTTEGSGALRMFDANAGQWTGPNVDTSALPPDYGRGWGARGSSVTSVLLPLVPPNYSARVLATNSPHATSFLVDINATPAWLAAPTRQGSAAGTVRANACAVLLPTGQVLVTGGTKPNPNKMVSTDPDSVGVLEPELYTPDIDWSTGDFTGLGNWRTVNEPATVPRGYHSVALLLPDGRVWTAGTTESWAGLAAAEKRVELFSPWYTGMPRPQVLSIAPKRRPGRVRTEGFDYGETLTATVTGTIERVALTRCGSVTHGYDSDQRYVGLAFTQRGDQLTMTAPRDGSVAPPGYYMLWIIDDTGVPCESAVFVHLPKIKRVVKGPPIHKRPKRPPLHPHVRPIKHR